MSTSQRPLSFQVEARRRFEMKEGHRNSSSEIMTTSEINQQRPGLLYRNTNGLEVHQGGEAVQLSMHRRFGKRVDTKANFVTFRSHMHNSFLPIPSNVFVYGEIRDAKRRRDDAENIKVRCCSSSSTFTYLLFFLHYLGLHTRTSGARFLHSFLTTFLA